MKTVPEHRATIRPEENGCMKDSGHGVIRLLTGMRDARLVWDTLGFLYNQRIYPLIAGLYESIAEELKVQDGARILEAGAGRGYLSLLLASRNPKARFTGIDFSRMQVRRAERYRLQKKIFNCSFQQNDVQSLPFPEAAFDAAVSVGSIKHWSVPPGLSGLRRVIKPDGCDDPETNRKTPDDELRNSANASQFLLCQGLLFWGLRRVVFRRACRKINLRTPQASRLCGRATAVTTCPYVMVKAWK